MTTLAHTWYTDQESPGFKISLLDDAGAVVDLSTGFTVTVQIVRGSTLVVTQTASLTLYNGSAGYNITVDQWATATLTAIAADLVTLGRSMQTYEVRPYIRRTSGSLDEVPTSHDPLTVVFKVAAV